MAMESTQSLTDMRTKNLPGDKKRPVLGLTTFMTSVGRLPRNCGILGVSQPCRSPRPATGFVLCFLRNIRTSLIDYPDGFIVTAHNATCSAM
jgi:hypothetical protein